MKRLLLTGAAGAMGRAMRSRLAGLAETLRLSDIADPGAPGLDEEVRICDLADAAAVMDLVEGCDGIVHLGGISVEDSFSKIMQANLLGLYNLYEAARAHGRPRILFASSNHAIGYYPQSRRLKGDEPFRPDGLYGVSKAFGESLARMYYEKFGQESALVRIGSCTPQPSDRRMLSSWLSYDDFAGLAACVFRAPRLECPVIWGASANDAGWWDNAASAYLGWRPKDNAEAWRAEIEAAGPRPSPDAAVARYQGGVFTENPIIQGD
ncbi:NAD(P)-dependent oxidoreductase [Neomegalonema sp.]|uniref:NAD-dependent epimerase/dehydratase family protein n=1 Tax=Neomegalonema sp. TaxID=2039713 RepID=UPI002625EF4B|nr:NAD(P)-dependent oxidoreductase [Neomegalonema sp.]MDD2870160.1 NAD(P)-dependent oxidoreductase [Neomegalonema sp.]